MTWSIIITLIIAGLIFLVLEILVIPGTTVIGVVGFILLIISIWGAYTYQGTVYGHYTLAATFILTFIALYFSLRSKTWKKLALNNEIDSKVNVIDENAIKQGDTGITVSRLAPMGNAQINGDIYEVATHGDFIDQEKEIIVIKVEKNKIIVKLKTD